MQEFWSAALGLFLMIIPSAGGVYPATQDVQVAAKDKTPPTIVSFSMDPLILTPNRMNLVKVSFGFKAKDRDLGGGFFMIRPLSVVGDFIYEADGYAYIFNDKRYNKAKGKDEFTLNILCEGWRSVVFEGWVIDRNLLSSQPLTVTVTSNKKRPKEKQGITLGKRAYDFQLYDQNGKLVRLSNYRGKVVLIDFCSVACEFSSQFSLLCEDLQKQYGPEDFIALTLVYQDKDYKLISRGEGSLWAKKLGLTHPVLDDISASVRTVFLSHGFAPAYLILDRNGIIRLNDFGITPEKQAMIELKIEELLNP